MHTIFGNAEEMVIYIGEQADNSRALIETLASLGISTVDRKQDPEFSVACWKLQRDPLRGAIVSFLRRRWFSRIWVIQEIHFARRAILTCGEQIIGWERFRRATLFWYHELVPLYSIEGIPQVLELQKEESHSLLPLLQSARPCGASDPRDKIYAVKNMIEPSSIGEIRYDLPTDQVYLDFAIQELEASQSLRLLSYVQSTEYSPSWVPDFSNMSSRQIIPRNTTGAFDELTAEFSSAGDPLVKVP